MAKKKTYIKDDTTRIASVAPLIAGGYIKTWADVFNIVPRSVVAAHLNINNTRMKELVEDPSGLTLQRLAAIADFLNVKFSVLADLAYKALPERD